jgi:energy-coupling factor transport system ATP-binding protein
VSLTFDHVSYVYPNTGVRAVDDVTLEVADDDFLVIIGHTGCGKSTLVQLAGGILEPTSGRMLVDGDDLAAGKRERRELRRRIGFVFQYPENQLFADTVFDDVAFGPRHQGLSAEQVETNVRWALEHTGLDLDAVRDRSPFDFSGGQRRAIALAGVIAMRPRILILDEPVAGLDPRSHQALLELLLQLHGEGMQLVMVSHDMDDVARCATNVLVMQDGAAFSSGTPEAVFAQPHELRRIGLGVPQVLACANALRDRGFDIPTGLLDVEGLARAIAGGVPHAR